MKLCCIAFFALAFGANFLPLLAADNDQIFLVLDGSVAQPVELAVRDLENALHAKRFKTKRCEKLPAEGPAVMIGLGGKSAQTDAWLTDRNLTVPAAPESLLVARLPLGPPRVVIAGRDERGLSYALLDVARAVETATGNGHPLMATTAASESPLLRVRNISVHPFNEDLEEGWYFDEEHWQTYFKLLAQSRYNTFTLTFADQTNYLNPLYAYLFDVPGFPDVKVKDLTDVQRKRNLNMLRRIAELAHDRGLNFTLGLWMQLPVAHYSAEVKVTGLPDGEKTAEYCARGLAQILAECPAIDGIQFRMNAEAGIPEDQQTAFYHPLFNAIRDCGRPVRLDLRFKGLRSETLKDARKLGLDVTVSTKFWCEHLGLPYHPTVADSHYRESRYSFGNLLAKPRDYRIAYQLWTVGSQRLLLWGDPEYAARFARSCLLGDGEGFEVFAPLTDKGFGNKPGKWRIFADPKLEHFTWEFERYWYFYLSFGRLGYNPDCNPEVWRRELRSRFGNAAEDIEEAYHTASQVLPLITATRQLSAGEWAYWPEMDTGDRLEEYLRAQPSDTTQFYAIRSFTPTKRWRTEAWDTDIPGYVEDAVAGKVSAKWTPWQVSERLNELSDQTLAGIESACRKLGTAASAEARATFIDLAATAHLAAYHAHKMVAATELALYYETKRTSWLPRALSAMQRAAAEWEALAHETQGLFSENLVFGHSPEAGRRQGHHHSGHWSGRLAEVREDVALLEQLVKELGGDNGPLVPIPGETILAELLRFEHEPVAAADSAADLTISARVTSRLGLKKVLLHYRNLDQTLDWQVVEMKLDADKHYRATISHEYLRRDRDLQYYFEALYNLSAGGGRLWPSWETGPPYYVVEVREAKPSKHQ